MARKEIIRKKSDSIFQVVDRTAKAHSLLDVAESCMAEGDCARAMKAVVEVALIEDALLLDYDLVPEALLPCTKEKGVRAWYPKGLVEWLESPAMAKYQASVRFAVIAQWVDLLALRNCKTKASAAVIAYGVCKRAASWYHRTTIDKRYSSFLLYAAVRAISPLPQSQAAAALRLLSLEPSIVSSPEQSAPLERQQKIFLDVSIGLWPHNLGARLFRVSRFIALQNRGIELRRILDCIAAAKTTDPRIPLWQTQATFLYVHGPENRLPIQQEKSIHPVSIQAQRLIASRLEQQYATHQHAHRIHTATVQSKQHPSSQSFQHKKKTQLFQNQAFLISPESSHAHLSRFHSELREARDRQAQDDISIHKTNFDALLAYCAQPKKFRKKS